MDNLSVAIANAINIPARTPTIATDRHSFPVSKNVNATKTPASIAIDIARFLSALVLISSAVAFNTFEKLFTTFATLFKIFLIGLADFPITLPTFVSTSPTPSNGAVKLSAALPNDSAAFENLLAIRRIPEIAPAENTCPQLIFPSISAHFEPKSLI